MLGVNGRKVVVTGAASGIGSALIDRLLVEGAGVFGIDINFEQLERLNKDQWGNRVGIHGADVSKRPSVEKAFAEVEAAVGGIDTLINCAGIIELDDFLDISEESWNRVLDINLKGVFFSCQVGLPQLVRSGRGVIVNISSDAGKKGWPRRAHYVASKFGVIGLTEVIAVEFGKHNVRANCVCPSTVSDTAMAKRIRERNDEMRTAAGADPCHEVNITFPLGRAGSTRDVVGAIMFLISDEANWISGESINIDGGSLAG